MVLIGAPLDSARPLFAPWYRLVQDGDRLLLEHGQEVVVLEGAAVHAFLPALLPLLDGTRTIDELAQVLGAASRPAIEHALEVLGAHGVLGVGAVPAVGDPSRAAALAFAASHRVAPSVVAERARTVVLAVVGDAPVGAEVARIVRHAGLSTVRHAPWDSADGDLVLVAPTPAELPRLAAWNERALAAGTRWCAVTPFDGRLIGVGPLVVPHESACWSCLVLRRASNLDFRTDLARIEAIPTAACPEPGTSAVAAGLAASVVLRWLLAGDTTLPGRLFAVEPAPLPSISGHAVLRVPRCSACSTVETVAQPLPWHEARVA